MRRAMAALTVVAFLTLLVDVAGKSRPAVVLAPAAVFLVVGTLGFSWVERRSSRAVRGGYAGLLLGLGSVTFLLSHASVGATLMLVVLVVQTVLLLPLWAVVVVVAALPFLHTGMAFAEGIREGLGLLAVGAFAAVVTELLMREQRAREALAAAHERLREYALRVEQLAAVQERNRVARDIHDGLGHALTVVQMQIKAARAAPARAEEMLAKAQEQAEEALREVRRSVGALREPRPAEPLPEALRTMAAAFGTAVQVRISGTARALPADAEEALFRAAQEGLTNVRKHASATGIQVALDYSGAEVVALEVRDDGVGAGDSAGAGFGLAGLRERAARLGGEVTFSSVPGGGATLRMEVPG